MLDPQIDPDRRRMVLTAQIILAALVVGCTFFLLVVLLIVSGRFADWQLGPNKPMTLVGLVVAFSLLAARVVVPRVVTAQLLRQLARREAKEPDWKELFRVYQTTLILKAATLEGAIFLLLVMHMLERSPWTLALAVVFLVILLLHLPTMSRVNDWIERQSVVIREEQRFAI